MRLLLLGATGLVGGTVLTQALAKDAISEIVAPSRRPLAPRGKLINPVSLRLDELAPEVKSWRVDAVVCALGTTKAKAGSKGGFRYVDYTLPVVFATSAHGAGVETFALVSAIGAATVSDLTLLDPTTWALDQIGLDRPGNRDVQMDLQYDYRTNVPLYPEFQNFFRKNQPPTLIVWGKNDFIFPPEGAAPYSRDLKNLETHLLDTGHFALETHGEEIARLIERFSTKTR